MMRQNDVILLVDFIAYALLMAGLGIGIAQVAPPLAGLAYGLGFGGFCAGVTVGCSGRHGVRHPKATLAALSLLVILALLLNVRAWSTVDTDLRNGRFTLLLAFLMLFFSAGLLMLFWKHQRSSADPA